MSEKPLIHLIDDEDAVRRSASFLLKTSGYEVRAYASGVAFLKEARHPDPGCILLDIRMPEMDGLEVQRELNARIASPEFYKEGSDSIGAALARIETLDSEVIAAYARWHELEARTGQGRAEG